MASVSKETPNLTEYYRRFTEGLSNLVLALTTVDQMVIDSIPDKPRAIIAEKLAEAAKRFEVEQ